MTKYTPYLAVETPLMTQMFNECLRVIEGKFGPIPVEQQELMKLVYLTGIGRGVTNNAGDTERTTLLLETLQFSKHQVATSREQDAKEMEGTVH